MILESHQQYHRMPNTSKVKIPSCVRVKPLISSCSIQSVCAKEIITPYVVLLLRLLPGSLSLFEILLQRPIEKSQVVRVIFDGTEDLKNVKTNLKVHSQELPVVLSLQPTDFFAWRVQEKHHEYLHK